MIHPLNQPVKIPTETLEWAYSQRINPGQAFGLAVDDMFKHQAMRKLVCTIPPKFAHFDLQMGDLKIEVKTSSEKTFTFSIEQYAYIREHLRNEAQFRVLFYINNLEAETTTYIGKIDAKDLFEHGLFQSSDINPGSQMLIRVEHVLNYFENSHQ